MAAALDDPGQGSDHQDLESPGDESAEAPEATTSSAMERTFRAPKLPQALTTQVV